MICDGEKAVAIGGEAVSSTRIRQAIARGAFDIASQLLGRPYALASKVIRGAGIGDSLGFPTANMDTTGLALPPDGVYAAQVIVADQTHRAVVNLGTRPTFSSNTEVQLEAHLLDFSGDLYGQQAELIWVDRIREERRFENKEALMRQINLDIEQARTMF